MEFTARMAQEQLARLDNEALSGKLADVAIAIALRRRETPQQVLRDALGAFGWSEPEWHRKVEPHLREELDQVLERPE